MECCIRDPLSGIKNIIFLEYNGALVFLGGQKLEMYFRYFEIPKKY
jgi:hypothetical protein